MKQRQKRKLTRPSIKRVIFHITPPGINIFLDLGFPLDEAADLLEQAKQMIEERRLTEAKKAERKRRRPAAKKITGANNDL